MNICIFCHTHKKRPGFDANGRPFDGCCRTCAYSGGRNHGATCVGNTDTINFYDSTDPYYEFTNTYVLPNYVNIDGVKFDSTERYFQYSKFEGNPPIQAIIMTLPPGRILQQTAQKYNNYARSDWHIGSPPTKEKIMEIGLIEKFKNPTLRKLLLDTGNSKLVEHTSNDDYWGDGGNGSGQNRLGFLLEKVRRGIQNGLY